MFKGFRKQKSKKKFFTHAPGRRAGPITVRRADGSSEVFSAKRFAEEACSRPSSESLTYDSYLRSREWRELRSRIMSRDMRTCPCGAPALHVHHLTYERLFAEHDDDLVSVCQACHTRIHFLVSCGHVLASASRRVMG